MKFQAPANRNSPHQTNNGRRRNLFICLLLAGITLAIYWPVSRCEFINYDDPQFVTENPHLRDGLTATGIAWAFREPLLGNWHPITCLSLLLDYQLFGKSARAYHLVNLCLHIANTLLLFHLLRRMTQEFWPSALVAALFALHPIQVESVAWIAERKNMLSTFFGLLTLWTYWRYQQDGTVKWKAKNYLLAISFFSLGLMSKPMLVTWPFVLLLLDFWPLRRISSLSPATLRNSPFLILEKVPFFALSVAVSIIALHTHQESGDMPELSQFSVYDRIGNALVSYVRYLGKIIWPSHLAIPYPLVGSWPGWEIGLATILLVLATCLTMRWAHSRPFLLVGWLWFLGTLFPVIGLVQEGFQSMADRHAYIPSIGFFVMLVWGIKNFIHGQRRARLGFGAASIAALSACMVLTSRQLEYWRNGEILFQHTIDVTPPNVLGQMKLAESMIDDGRTEEGILHLNEALQIYPTLAILHIKIAQARASQGRFRESVDQYYDWPRRKRPARWRPNRASRNC
ncbi:MAG: hypothetical protein ABSD57_08510 [Verrucomicrobiota bacterium]